MAQKERIVSTVLRVVESNESKEQAKADLQVANERPIKELLANDKKDEDSKRND